MLRNIYSLQYSQNVFDDFIFSKPRGWGLFQNLYGNCGKDEIINMFRSNQKRWNIFKRTVKFLESVSNHPNLNIHEISRLCLTNIKRFSAAEDLKAEYREKFYSLGIDMVKDQAHSSRAT